ncbi:response regulator transcription factor [Streptomyces sp. NPDC057798]|uniref:response regulator transcription factor n=1 Tax=Streptomyces sp. NPDC057798 TaxID=3346252 RepID=UPI00368B9A81
MDLPERTLCGSSRGTDPRPSTETAGARSADIAQALGALAHVAGQMDRIHALLTDLLEEGRPPGAAENPRAEPVPPQRNRGDLLSPQEQRVLQLTSQGLSNRRIARELGISEQTVKNYLSSVFRKIGVGSRAEATRYWLESQD